MDIDFPFTPQQIEALDQPLEQRLVSTRKGSGNATFKYIEGHDVIDQANRVFGYGNWAYRPLASEQKVIYDPLTGEAVGVAYTTLVELTVRGCIAPIVEKGVQPVASWNVTDVVMGKRKRDDDKQRPIEQWERANAMRTIIEAHEMAEKGAVTDGLKRALRTFGKQFGNSLYGDTSNEQKEAAARSGHSQQQYRQNGASHPQFVVQQPSSIVANLNGLRQHLIKNSMIGESPEDWQKFIANQLGAPLPDKDISQEQYKRLMSAARPPQKVS